MWLGEDQQARRRQRHLDPDLRLDPRQRTDWSSRLVERLGDRAALLPALTATASTRSRSSPTSDGKAPAKASHSALELPMAVTGWLFGLDHFARNGYHWWPIVVGALFLLAYWSVLGVAFAGLADRVYRVRTLAGSLMLGAVWSFASFMLFWYMLLPIARDGAPFRITAAATSEFVAPNWVWILGFALSGLATGLAYRALAARGTTQAAAPAPTAPQQAA
jgi:hypothetical protein